MAHPLRGGVAKPRVSPQGKTAGLPNRSAVHVTGGRSLRLGSIEGITAVTDSCGHNAVCARCLAIARRRARIEGGGRSEEQDWIVPLGNGGRLRPPLFFAMVTSRKFPAVSIATKLTCCDAVSELEGGKILATAAPTLPMSNCTMPAKCRCRFQKYVDRRDDEQPEIPVRLRALCLVCGWPAQKIQGRRNSD